MLLPKEGDFTTLKQVRELREELSIGEKEGEEIGLTQHYECTTEGCIVNGWFAGPRPKCSLCVKFLSPTGGVQWDEEKEPNKDIQIPSVLLVEIEAKLQKMNDDKKLIAQLMSLYEKFCVKDTPKEEVTQSQLDPH